MKNVLADGRGGCVADSRLCRSRVAVKIFVFIILLNFCKTFNFVFHKIFPEFCEIQNNFVKIHVSLNFDHAVLQPPYVGVE